MRRWRRKSVLGAVGRRFGLRSENKRESASLESASDGSRVIVFHHHRTYRNRELSHWTTICGRQKDDAEALVSPYLVPGAHFRVNTIVAICV